MEDEYLRIGQAAALLGMSVDTLRRWEEDGRLSTVRTGGGQREVPLAEVRRLLEARRPRRTPLAAQSARNQMEAVVLAVTKGAAAATVEMQAGPFRLLALITAESVDDLDLRPGRHVVASVKATSVVVGLPE